VDADDANAVIVIGRFEGDGVEGDRLDEAAVQVWEFQGNAVSRVRIITDSAGFPAVMTERREKELEDKEREKEEAEKSDEKDGEAKASAEKEEKDEDKSPESASDDER
ncbi:MAG TPA: hypothetical protein VGO83_03800, partial [Thermoleophilaceae bacterium]|nr:hypothetical protein [Thermoleophilaceae bacterium]